MSRRVHVYHVNPSIACDDNESETIEVKVKLNEVKE